MINAPQSYMQDNTWGDNLWLLTPTELRNLPKGTPVESILGDEKFAGIDEIDEDTRYGYTAWGLHEDQFKTHKPKEGRLDREAVEGLLDSDYVTSLTENDLYGVLWWLVDHGYEINKKG